MSNVTHIESIFNNNVCVSFDGGNISSDSGLVLVKEFLHKIRFNSLLDGVRFNDSRKFIIHENSKILTELIFMIIAGYNQDSHADLLAQDPVFNRILDKGMASQPSVARFFDRCGRNTIDDLKELNYKLIEMFYTQKKDNIDVVIDLDSTHFDTFGKQEKSSYNTHYGTTGYHPLVAYDAVTKLQLFSHLREGSQYTSKGVDNYVRELMTRLEKSLVISSVLFRGDSGFATPAAYEVFEELIRNML